MITHLKSLLHLRREPVGIKRLFGSESDNLIYETLDFERVKHKAYYCWLVKKASEGRAFKLDFGQFACETAGWVLGLAPSDHFGTPQENINGWFGCETYANEQVAKMIYNGIQPLKPASGVLIAPLDSFPEDVEPDVVIMIGKPYTLMRIVQSYSAHYGFATQMKMSGMCGICFESTALPIQTHSITLSTLCSGTRYFAKWGEDEMAASLPYHLLKDLVAGALLTLNPCEPDGRKKALRKTLPKTITIQMKQNYFLKK